MLLLTYARPATSSTTAHVGQWANQFLIKFGAHWCMHMCGGGTHYTTVAWRRIESSSFLISQQQLGGFCYERITVVLCGLAIKGVILPPCPLRHLKHTDLVGANNWPHYILRWGERAAWGSHCVKSSYDRGTIIQKRGKHWPTDACQLCTDTSILFTFNGITTSVLNSIA